MWMAARFVEPASVRSALPLVKSSGEATLLGDRFRLLGPVQAPGDHEVDHDEQVFRESKDDAFSEAFDRPHLTVRDGVNGGCNRPQDERILDPNAFQTGGEDA